MNANDVVAEARDWIGTPFVAQQHAKHFGCDCVGLIGGVAVQLGIVPADFWERAFKSYHGYGQQPFNNTLLRGCREFLVETAVAKAGDVVVMTMDEDPQHLGILAPYLHGGLSLVHAMNRGRRCVVEHRLAPAWRELVVASFRYPGVD